MDFISVLRVAFRSLGRHKLRSCLTMLGIVIGIAAVVASVSFGQGANQMVQAQIASMGTNLLYDFAGSMGRGGIRQGWGSISSLTVDDARAIASD
jgi:putative ABC transport system permease protein